MRVAGTRRAHMKEKAELLQQEQLWQEITTSREASVKVAEARAEALLRATAGVAGMNFTRLLVRFAAGTALTGFAAALLAC